MSQASQNQQKGRKKKIWQWVSGLLRRTYRPWQMGVALVVLAIVEVTYAVLWMCGCDPQTILYQQLYGHIFGGEPRRIIYRGMFWGIPVLVFMFIAVPIFCRAVPFVSRCCKSIGWLAERFRPEAKQSKCSVCLTFQLIWKWSWRLAKRLSLPLTKTWLNSFGRNAKRLKMPFMFLFAAFLVGGVHLYLKIGDCGWDTGQCVVFLGTEQPCWYRVLFLYGPMILALLPAVLIIRWHGTNEADRLRYRNSWVAVLTIMFGYFVNYHWEGLLGDCCTSPGEVIGGIGLLFFGVAAAVFALWQGQIANQTRRAVERGNALAREANALAREANRNAEQQERAGHRIAEEGNRIAEEQNRIAEEANRIAERRNRRNDS